MVLIQSRSRNLRDTHVDLSPNTKVQDVLKAISINNHHTSIYRLRLTYLKENKQVPIISDDLPVGFGEEKLYVKDLGPQISWRMVFVCEYLGPIVIHSLLYMLSKRQEQYDPLNHLVYLLISLHYLKREFETIFVHQFSQATMPFFNLFKNCFHYWVLNGFIALGYFGKGFLFNDSDLVGMYKLVGGLSSLVAFFAIFELWNFYTHIRLRMWGNYQKSLGNTRVRLPLNDGIFKLLVSPNYTFELLSWLTFTLIFKLNFFAIVFTVVSGVQMYLWAQKKNKKYGTKRAFLIPYLF